MIFIFSMKIGFDQKNNWKSQLFIKVSYLVEATWLIPACNSLLKGGTGGSTRLLIALFMRLHTPHTNINLSSLKGVAHNSTE